MVVHTTEEARSQILAQLEVRLSMEQYKLAERYDLYIASEGDAAHEVGDTRLPESHIRTSSMVMGLYWTACSNGYRPAPREILALHLTLPEQLQPLEQGGWRRGTDIESLPE